jgi:Domain of unknown function (DUF4082)
LLGAATLSNGPAVPNATQGTGWVYLGFASPIPVVPGDRLVAGVHHPNGAYAYRLNGFSGRSVTSVSGCMTSPATTAGAGNGLYEYSRSPVRPTLTYDASEYFISPDFERSPTAPTTAPTTSTTLVPPAGERLYGASQIPPGSVALGAVYPVETGQRINVACNGALTGIWWYRISQDTGVNTVSLWKGSALLARTAGDPASTGWVFLAFASPVPVGIGDQLVASVHHPNGAYAQTLDGFLARGISSPQGCLTSPAWTSSLRNGLYAYSATPRRPDLSYRSAEYWITPQFTPA